MINDLSKFRQRPLFFQTTAIWCSVFLPHFEISREHRNTEMKGKLLCQGRNHCFANIGNMRDIPLPKFLKLNVLQNREWLNLHLSEFYPNLICNCDASIKPWKFYILNFVDSKLIIYLKLT